MLEPLTQISIKKIFPLYFLHKTSNIYNEQKNIIVWVDSLVSFFWEFFFIATSNSTENRKLKQYFGVTPKSLKNYTLNKTA